MGKTFEVFLVGDLDYEGMVVDICYGNHKVAMVTEEKGVDNLEIEIYPPPNDEETWHLELNEFLSALEWAKTILVQGLG